MGEKTVDEQTVGDQTVVDQIGRRPDRLPARTHPHTHARSQARSFDMRKKRVSLTRQAYKVWNVMAMTQKQGRSARSWRLRHRTVALYDLRMALSQQAYVFGNNNRPTCQSDLQSIDH